MISNSKLKPCPFCGDSVNITYTSFENAFEVWHDNNKCPFVEPFFIDEAESLSEAYNIWNTRSTD